MNTLTRRGFLAASGVATAGAVTVLGTSIAFAAPGVPSDGDVLVVLHLGGGADGLSLTPPVNDSTYYDVRPTIAIPQPGQANGSLHLTGNGRVRFSPGFDGAFGLHPAAKSLYDGLWSAGKLAIIPGAGFKGSTLSHFTSYLHHARGSLSVHVGGTWLGRMTNAQGGNGEIPSVYDGSGHLEGGLGKFAAVGRISRFKGGIRPEHQAALAAVYTGRDRVSAAGRHALDLSAKIGELENGHRPGYPENGFGLKLSELAALLKRQPSFGIRAAAIGAGSWDMHDKAGAPGDQKGRFQVETKGLADAVQAFANDTNGLQGITLVITTEFGRSINENGSGGTDHGEALTMMVAGGGIRGGVYGDDYAESLVLPNGERRASLPIMTDYRKPASEVIRKRVRLGDLSPVFPDFNQSGADFGIA